jgi:heme o synthase
VSMPESSGVSDSRFRRLAAITALATYALLLTGSTVVASGADSSCHTWPLCGSGFTPDFSGANAFTMLHRGAVLGIGILIVYVLVTAFRRWGMRSQIGLSAIATLAVFTGQTLVGAGAALTDGAFFNGLHVALATLVWSGVLTCALLTLTRTDRIAELSQLATERSSA